ncbi:phosphopentomutase [Nocardioides zhouii]|uniref:Phosphopentomutase n=1 Tax=Nocardioides zhouii TaxID=1168729 RepID=A0A4Q2SLN2_9ACTN|nr:phosphopentomutase [Nocardioides zhouii]RYC05921.1 phosphopentomutase [Nocardioides zhouii]
MIGRAVVLVLDGFGVGAAPDCTPSEADMHTLRHVAGERVLNLPELASLGLGRLAPGAVPPHGAPLAAYGRLAPVHPGADTYLGHQELMGGGLAMVELKLMDELGEVLTEALVAAGHRVEPLVAGESMLLVDGTIVVHDNIEARARLNVNVTASLDDVGFDRLTEVGSVVRRAINVSRVIVVGSRGFDVDDIRAHVVDRGDGHIGVDTPGLGVYTPDYRVRHLGLDFPIERQLPTRMHQAGGRVVLLGKAADVVRCEGAALENLVATAEVLDAAVRHLDSMERGLIVANVQETDLAGHEQDRERYARVLELVDSHLARFLERIGPEDALFVTADHGNDPTSGSSRHTRELVPILAYSPSFVPVDLGVRSTLADVGATVADLHGLGALDSGTSFAKEILCSST